MSKPSDCKRGVGIATGLVVVGDLIGEGSAQEQSVVGETSASAIISATARWYAAMTSRRSSGSSRADNAVRSDQVAEHD
jgi:hypothetical protein